MSVLAVRALMEYVVRQCTCCWSDCDCGCVTECVTHKEAADA